MACLRKEDVAEGFGANSDVLRVLVGLWTGGQRVCVVTALLRTQQLPRPEPPQVLLSFLRFQKLVLEALQQGAYIERLQ